MSPTPNFLRDPGALNVPWVDSPFFESLLEATPVPETLRPHLVEFARDGYTTFDPEAPVDELDVLIDELRPHYRPDSPRPGTTVDRIQDAWAFSERVRQLALLPRVLELLRVLYRREPLPFQTLNFPHGTQQATHADSFHFSTHPPGFLCGVWIALEDVDTDNGPLHYVPGSQRLPYLSPVDFGYAGSLPRAAQAEPDRRLYEDVYEPYVDRLIEARGVERVEVRLRKGQALVWAANLLHGGSPIRDPSRSRHSQVTHYYFEGCLYYLPRTSDPFLGRRHPYVPRNVATGEVLPQTYAGLTVTNPGEPLPEILGRNGQRYGAIGRVERIARKIRDALPI